MKTNSNKTFALFMIFLIFLTPITFARTPDVRTPKDTLDKDEPEVDRPEGPFNDEPPESSGPEDIATYDFSDTLRDNLKEESLSKIATSVTPPLSLTNPITVNTPKDENVFNPKGQFSTHLFTGSATYSYPVEVIPGINRLEPSISINYNHHRTSLSGVVGHGWDLSVSYISRDTRGTRSDTSDDVFYLNLNGINSKLIYDSEEDLYHTEHESYLKIKKLEPTWAVINKNGIAYHFGNTLAGRLESELEPYTSIWYLNIIKDRHENKVYYDYIKNPSSDKGVYLDKIRYNNDLTKIDFDYSFGKHIAFDGYRYGTYLKNTALLQSIIVSHDEKTIRKYLFTYKDVLSEKFLESIQEEGSNGQKLPATEFSYNIYNSGWDLTNELNLPPDINFGRSIDQGTRLVDISGDGVVDLVKMKGNNELSYWKNTLNGWNNKQTISTPFTKGIVDSGGNDQGLRFVDINDDKKIDIIQLLSGNKVAKKLLVNTGDDWNEESPTLPNDVNFIEKKEIKNCIPSYCNFGYTDKGISCDNLKCVRKCSTKKCSDSETNVYSESDLLYWGDDDYEEEDRSYSYKPSSSSYCYRFDYTGSDKKDSSDSSECYDLYTNDIYKKGDYQLDGDGDDVDAYAGIGFISRNREEGWLTTLPSDGKKYGFIGNVENSYWKNRYLVDIDRDGVPDEKGKDAGDWDGFTNSICDKAGTYSIYCAPTYAGCELWGKNKCGWNCKGESTGPFIVFGVYWSRSNDFRDALNDNEPADSSKLVDDNDYSKGDSFKVFKYTTSIHYDNQECDVTTSEVYSDTGTFIIDVDGDGDSDIVKGVSGIRKTWINTPNGYIEDDEWTIPFHPGFVSSDSKDQGIRIADINADGLPDLIQGHNSVRSTQLNTGRGWIKTDKFKIPEQAVFVVDDKSRGVKIIDINNDGLPDLIRADGSIFKTWINTKNGWLENPLSWKPPSEIKFTDYSATIADINGDSMLDIISVPSANQHKIFLNRFSKPYLLWRVKSQNGGETQINYKNIANFDNTGTDNINDLIFNGWVVSSIRTENGLINNHQNIEITAFDYFNGLYNSDKKEFRGFGKVIETPLSNVRSITHWFYQTDDKKGLEYKTEIVDTNEKPYYKIEYDWESNKINDYYIIKLNSRKDYLYEGLNENPKVTKTKYNYGDYGNIIKRSFLGDVSVDGDEVYEYSEYLYNIPQWIVNKPKRIYVYDSDDSTKISEILFSYDNQNYGTYPKQGDITKVEYWLPSGNPIYNYGYDSYGNLISETDTNSHTTSYVYDSTNRFPIKIINAKNHEYNYEFDLGTGNLLSETDPTGYKTEYKYDSFGRIIKEILPYDSESYPTTSYTYEMDGIAPEKIKISYKESSSNTLDEYYFYDGFGRLVQSKREGESKQIVQDIFYDELGRIKKESNPYFKSFSSSYSTPESVNSIEYIYDILNRITKIKKSDNTKININYDRWTISTYDENNHRKDYVKDAYGRIIEVKEYNDDEIYSTKYKYDTTDNLIEIQDNQNNKIKYIYDSLGRKIKLEDPDLGTWTYEYDAAGNLIKQRDAKGNIITLTYDELNRITSKNNIKYYYDDIIGTLSKITTPELTTKYYYDQRLRTFLQEKIIDGITFTTSWGYDSMDRVTSKTLPNNEVITYSYNNQGNLEKISGIITNINYNEMDQPKLRKYANNLQTDLTYDSENFRLTKIKTSNLQDLNYNYDNVGNVLEKYDSIKSKKEVMQYDDLDRLTHSERTNDFNLDYKYDSIGNMLGVSTILEENNIIFSYDNPTHAPGRVNMGKETQFNIPLKKGLNLISMPLNLNDNSPESVFSSIEGKYNSVFSYENGEWKNFALEKPPFLNTLNGITSEYGYWIDMKEDAVLTLNGLEITSYTFNLNKDWNLIAYPLLEKKTITNDLISNLRSIFIYDNGWKHYVPERPEFLNTLKEFEPGYGYWVNVDKDTEWEIK